MQTYHARVVDDRLDWLLTSFPAVAIEGAKGVGKTRTASRLARTVRRLDVTRTAQAAAADPSAVLTGDPPLLLDEWQRVPETWDAVRRAVDDRPGSGRFILTGSSRPRGTTLHSGVGRIQSLLLRPMTPFERGFATSGPVSFAALLDGDAPLTSQMLDVTTADYARMITTSGFPDTLHLDQTQASTWLRAYVRRVLDRDVEQETGLALRSSGSMRRWLVAYAAATATTASYESVRDAATGGEVEKPAKSTSMRYRDALQDLWLVEEQHGWVPVGTRLRRAALAPKHHLVDPGLAAALLGVDTDGLRRDGRLFGALFESLVVHTIRVFSQRHDATVQHLRTNAGRHEIDIIVERPDGRVLAIEVKLGPDVRSSDVKHLHWLREQIGDRLVDTVVVTSGALARRRDDGIAVIPLAALGP